MDSRILKEIYESAKGMYEAGTMSREVYLNFKDIYEADKLERSGNKVPRKTK